MTSICRLLTDDSAPAPTRESTAGRWRFSRGAIALTMASFCCLPLAPAAEAAPFQQYKNGACKSGLICTIDFPVVKAGKRLEIANASCYLRVDGVTTIHAMQLLLNEGSTTKSALTLVPDFVDTLNTAPFQTVYSANHDIFMFANAGQRIQAYVEVGEGDFLQFACHISGQMGNAN